MFVNARARYVQGTYAVYQPCAHYQVLMLRGCARRRAQCTRTQNANGYYTLNLVNIRRTLTSVYRIINKHVFYQ